MFIADASQQIKFATLFNNFMIFLHSAYLLFNIDKISYILDISTLKQYPLPFHFVTSYAEGEIKVLPSLKTLIACSMKRGQTNRRIPSNNKNKLDTNSLRATSRSSVRLAPKISNYVTHDFDVDIIRSQSSRGIVLLL